MVCGSDRLFVTIDNEEEATGPTKNRAQRVKSG